MSENIAGVPYNRPKVYLLQETGIGTAEVAARTCYDSFDNSENECVTMFSLAELTDGPVQELVDEVNAIEHSDLLDQLAWTYFHHSILEHANLTYLIKGISRAVLQEHARHRIQGISVRSTRYTLGSVINAFVAAKLSYGNHQLEFFMETCESMDLFVTEGIYNRIELRSMFEKLSYQYHELTREGFWDIAVAKSSRPAIEKLSIEGLNSDLAFKTLQSGKAKRNVADNFKHIVGENLKVDLVVTMNLRALKNYVDLRASNAAWFQIQWLADAIIKATPRKYTDLIVKPDKLNKILKEVLT